MSELFDSLNTIENIQSLIDNSVRESDVLEYKGAQRKFTDPERNEIAKDISAMANSGGGVIVYGVITDDNDKTRPIALNGLAVENIETFDRVRNSTIRPPVERVQKKLIPRENPRVMVVYVPPSEDPPHQSLVDKKYYRRSGAESIPMEHDLVALHFGRRLGPILSVEFDSVTRPNNFSGGVSNEAILRVLVHNNGKRVGRFMVVVLFFPDQGFVRQIREINGRATNIDRLHPGKQVRQYTDNIGVSHPGTRQSILELGLVISDEFIRNHPDDPFVEWLVYSDNMSPRQGFVSLREIGWATL